MRVLVIGETGSIGRLVVEQLHEHGDRPRALTRDGERGRRLLGDEVEIVTGDVSDRASLARALAGVDAVIMTHGAPYGSGDYEAVDYGAVPSVLEALDGRTVRVALMSSIGVTGTGGSSRELLNWKRRGERLLRASGLPYTIVRPGWFDAGNGAEERVDLRQGDRVDYGPVRRDHVAAVLVQAIHIPGAAGKTLEVFSSEGPRVTDWLSAFAALEGDAPGSLDGVQDHATLPLAHEPERVRRVLGRFRRHQ